jgi:hypothetical protein
MGAIRKAGQGIVTSFVFELLSRKLSVSDVQYLQDQIALFGSNIVRCGDV